MKQDIIICPGIPKSGTTSLWKFLELNGFSNSEKESHYLTQLYGATVTDELVELPDFIPKDTFEIFFRDWVSFKLDEDYPDTYAGYIKYLTQNGFVDFSQTYYFLPETFLSQVKQELSEYNIKIILLFREPISRLLSHCHLFKKLIGSHINVSQIFDQSLEIESLQNLYPDVRKKFENVFDDVICLSTEKLFSSDDQSKKLCEFLNITNSNVNIKTIRENVNNNYSGLKDLTQCQIDRARELLKPSMNTYDYI
tara:strand:- start:69 stop:827 length:759 start_codon:yes stop_codon:yes gene_type:complete